MAKYAEAASKGYAELQAKFTQMSQAEGADVPLNSPAELAATIGDLSSKYDRLDGVPELTQELAGILHGQGMGPKRAAAVIEAVLTKRQGEAPARMSMEEQRSRVVHELGPSGAAIATRVANKMHAMEQDGRMDAEGFEQLVPLAGSAAGMRVLDRLLNGAAPPPDASQVQQGQQWRQQEIADIRKGLTDPNKLADPAFIERYRKLAKEGFMLDGKPVQQPGRGFQG